jgi:DNA-binding response OmpR family regulator
MKANAILSTGKPASLPVQPQPNHPRRILVVEDDVDIRRLTTGLLMEAGYHVEAAKDGKAAWDTLKLVSYDLLITDNGLPTHTGLGLLKRIHAAGLDLPVIMASGTLPVWDFSVFPWLRPLAMLPKPYTILELLGKVKDVLRITNRCLDKFPAPCWQSYLTPDCAEAAVLNRDFGTNSQMPA